MDSPWLSHLHPWLPKLRKSELHLGTSPERVSTLSSEKFVRGSFHFQQGREDFQGFRLLKENDGVDFLLLFSLFKILMVLVIIVQAPKS